VLLREKQQIEKKVAGKDKALEKKNYDRLKEINTALEIIGSRADTKKEEVKTKQQLKEERDAISEQETTPVDEDQQATDVQEVEEGVPTAEPQQTTVEETTTEQVEKAPLTEEQQEVVSLEEDIEGKVTEGRELPGQEVVEETQEVTEEAPVDDRKLVYDEKKTRSKGQQLVIDRAQRAIKAVSKILPDAKIVIHESSKDFKNVTGKDGSGALIDGTIHLNMDKANNRTIAHEVMHAVLIKKLGTESDIRKVTARMLESVKKGLVKGGGKVQITTTETIDGKEVKTTQDVTIEEYLDKFAENYEENMQNEEKVVELAGLLANNYAKLEVKEKGVIKRWIQKVFKPIAAKLGINLNEVTKTDKDIVDFLNVVSRKTTTGDVITDTETEVLTRVKEEAPVVEKKVTEEVVEEGVMPSIEESSEVQEVDLSLRDMVSNRVLNILKSSSTKQLLDNIKNIDGKKFRGYTLRYKPSRANSFRIELFDGKNKVGNVLAFIYENKKDVGLQIQEVNITPKYRGKGIMSTFYNGLNNYLKTEYDSFKDFSSDYIFLLEKGTNKYPGFEMWEGLVRRGKAERLGPKENYIPPKDSPKKWFLKTGYRLKQQAPAVEETVTKKKPKEPTKKVTEEKVKVSEEVTTPIAKPKVVVSGTSDGYKVVSSSNTTKSENESVKDARGDKTFDKDGFRITKLEDGSSQVSYKSKVNVIDKGGRPGYAMATVIIPEGSPINKQQIQEAFDNKLSEIIESNRKKKLGTKLSNLTPKQNQQLTDAVVNALSQERVADKVTPVVEAAPTKKKINWTKSQGKRPKRKTTGTELGKLVRQYEGGEITIEEYNEQAEKLSPTRMKEKFTEPATEAELGKLRKGKLEKRNAKVEDGVEVGLRIDIPFMEDTGQASVTIHKGKGLSSPAVSYRGSAVIENVEFKSSPSGSLKLASEVTTKNPTLARMVGNFVNIGETIEQQNEAAKKLSEQAMNEGWTQVGVNPSKHSYFYDRATGKPLKSADRVVQVGDLIYAENAKTTDIYDSRFIVKGKTDKAGKPLRFQKADIEVSENEIIFDKVPPKEVLSSILRSLKSRLRAEDIYFNDTVVEVFEDYVKGNEVNINAENYPIQIQEALEGDDMTYGEIANMLRIAGLYDTNAAALKGISEIGKKAGVDMMLQVQEEVDKIADRFQSDFSDKETKLSFVYDKNGERFNKLKRDGFITTDKKIKDYDGQIMFLHQPDGAFSGMIYKDGELLVEGSGGMYYPIKFHQDGFFWASTEDAAKSMARKLNESMDQNGGKLLMGLITAPSDKLLSSTTMSNAVMDFFSSKAFDKTFNLTENQLRVALRKAANQKLVQVDKKTGKKKTIGLNLNIPASASVEQIKSEIQEKLGHDNSSFKDRKFFATELIGNMAEVINRSQASVDQFGKLFSEGIQNEYFKGVTKTGKLKISKANMVQALSEMFTEPVLKSEGLRDKSGQVYAVLELDSKVKPVKSDKHKSYPFALKSVNKNAKVKLNVLEEGQLWGEVFEDPETNDIITKERLTNVLPTNAGVSTQGLRVNTSRIASQEVSEIADREQKSLIQIGRYYNANNQGFFPAQVNEFQLRRDLQAIGLDLKRAKNGAYYATRNGRKANIFPPPPSPYSRFQRADIEITEPTVFNKKDTAEDIIRTARKKGYNDKSIRFYLLNRRKGEFKAKEVDALLKIDATLFDQLPESFAEVEGGAIAGLKLFEKIDKFRQKLMDQNNRIKKPFLEEKQIQELVKEKRKELKKQGLSKEEIRKKLEAFEKRERANNKKRTKRLTLSEIMDKTIEFMEQQPEYKREADSYVEDGVTKYRKGVSTQQAKMQAELQETIGQKPTKEVAENLAKLKRNVKSWEKGQRDLQAIKNELKRLIRKHLPKDMYTKSEVLKLIKAISDANKDNINVQIEKVQELIVKKTNQRLTNEALDLLNIETQTKQSGRLKGVKVSNDVRKRLDAIKKNVLDPKDLNFKDEIAVTERNAELTKQFNELNKKVEKTQEDFQEMNDLQIAIGLNQAQLLEMNDSYRISPMETVVDSLDRLIMGGRGMFQLELEQAHAEYQRQFAELWEQITGQKLDMSDPDIQDKINETLSKDYSREQKDAAVNRFARIFVRAYRSLGRGINKHEALFGLMDKINVMPGELAGGRIQEIITERVDEASIKYKGRMMEQETIIEDKGKEIFGRRWKSKLRSFNEISLIDPEFVFKLPNRKRALSQNEMAYMYNQFKDPTLHPTFESMLGENYEQIMKELESKLDPKLKQWADWMVDEYFPSVYEHYNETYKKIYRTDMPFNENYAGRIFREGIEENKPLDLLGEGSIYQTSVAPASTKVRVNNKNHIRPMDINTALTTYVQDMEYFAAYAEPMRDIHKMFSNNNTKDFLENQYGKNINKLIQDQITKISGKGTKNYATALFVNTFTNMFIFSRLALSPVVFLKQLTSSFTYANDIGIGNWLKYSASSILKTPAGMGKTWREISENSVYLQDRAKGANIKRAISNYYDTGGNLFRNDFVQGMQRALMITTRKGDKLAIMLGGMPNYLYYKDQYRKQNPTATEQEVIDYAIKKFERDTKQTQQSSDIQDRDYYQTGDGFSRAFNMFLTTPKQYLRKEIVALRNLRKIMTGKGDQARGTLTENARQFVMYHFIMPMLYQWVASGFPMIDDWDEEDTADMARAATIGNLNGLFLIGDVIQSLGDMFTDKPWAGNMGGLPFLDQAGILIKSYMKYNNENTKDKPNEEKLDELKYELMYDFGETLGLPVNKIDRVINNAAKYEDAKTIKEKLLRIALYSDYVIEGPKDKRKKKKKGGVFKSKKKD
jgi:hypothetical protein